MRCVRPPSTSARSREAKGLPLGRPAEYDATYYLHQVPGGVMTTMSRQLEEMRRPELFDEAIEEIERVRADFGYPIVVTPYAQFLVTQAVFNVMARHRGAERYADVPDEIVRYFLGHFGDPPAPPDPERGGPGALAAASRRAAQGGAAQPGGRPRDASVPGSPTRSCCCA